MKRKNLLPFSCFPVDGESNIFKSLLSFDESNNLLEFENYTGTIEKVKVSFEPQPENQIKNKSLILMNDLYQGRSIDYHSVSSKSKKTGHFDTNRTEIGELLYQLKYLGNKSLLNKIVAKIVGNLKSNPIKANVLIPIPPSNRERSYQPLYEIAKQIGLELKVQTDLAYLIKKITPQIKGIDDNETRKELLKNAFSVIDKRYKGETVLLFDDLYRFGETLNAAAKVLKEQGEVGDIRVLTITKTRTKK